MDKLTFNTTFSFQGLVAALLTASVLLYNGTAEIPQCVLQPARVPGGF